ncbi:hypothetical protein D9M69_578630 [compost metagenome]
MHRLIGEDFQGLDAVAGEVQHVVLALEHAAKRGEDARFVVHQQQPIGRCRCLILRRSARLLADEQR